MHLINRLVPYLNGASVNVSVNRNYIAFVPIAMDISINLVDNR